MTADIQILTQTADQLKIYSPAGVDIFLLAITLVAGVGAFWHMHHSYWARATPVQKAAFIFILVSPVSIAFFTSVWSHTVTLSRSQGDVMIEDRFAGITYSTRHYPLSQMRDAIIQYAHPGPRVALLMRNGQVVIPLGKAYNPRGNLYASMELMSDFIHRNTSSVASHRSTTEQLK